MPDGSLSKSGPPALLVTENSAARIGLKDNIHQHLPLAADHSGLVKFDRFSSEYEQVEFRLKEVAKKTQKAVSDRFALEQGVRS